MEIKTELQGANDALEGWKNLRPLETDKNPFTQQPKALSKLREDLKMQHEVTLKSKLV